VSWLRAKNAKEYQGAAKTKRDIRRSGTCGAETSSFRGAARVNYASLGCADKLANLSGRAATIRRARKTRGIGCRWRRTKRCCRTAHRWLAPLGLDENMSRIKWARARHKEGHGMLYTRHAWRCSGPAARNGARAAVVASQRGAAVTRCADAATCYDALLNGVILPPANQHGRLCAALARRGWRHDSDKIAASMVWAETWAAEQRAPAAATLC